MRQLTIWQINLRLKCIEAQISVYCQKRLYDRSLDQLYKRHSNLRNLIRFYMSHTPKAFEYCLNVGAL